MGRASFLLLVVGLTASPLAGCGTADADLPTAPPTQPVPDVAPPSPLAGGPADGTAAS